MTTKNLTAYNEANEREISMMVGKAMCALANAKTAKKQGMEHVRIACESEYEATVRCIDMFVKESLYEIQFHVIAETEKMMAE